MKKEKQSIPVREFFAEFPDDEACLQHLFNVRFGQGFECPKCKKASKWYRIKAERAYSCTHCGNHLHPTVGTPFEDSRTSLQMWFYAIYLFTASRHGVSGKELERQLGVTYKTAWRIGHEIRKHMAYVDGEEPLSGQVEIDETYIGPKVSGLGRGPQAQKKSILMGMLQRDGDLITKIVPNCKKETLIPGIKEHVQQGSLVNTDQLHSYKRLDEEGYAHEMVDHSAREYARGETHTNTIESFWRHFKHSLKGTHIHVSKKHLAKYAKEFEYRFNSRTHPKEMFPELVSSFAKSYIAERAEISTSTEQPF